MYRQLLSAKQYRRAAWVVLPGLWLLFAGTGFTLADDRPGGVGVRGPGFDVNVQWGNAQPINAPYTVQVRGPVHEAFAEPILFEPSPGYLIPRRPPIPLDEVPPDVYPVVSGNVTWIPGYWAWDDDRGDFLWVSGLWRNVPPGRQYVPGYWLELTTGFQWVSGFWIRDDVETVQYLPQPPESLERGPQGQPPGPGYVWVPGIWLWRDVGYLWRPGYWAPIQPDWVWVPDHYVWAPSGYIFVDGYWDYSLTRRGLLFAPVYVPTPVVGAPPRFVYRPSVVVNVAVLAGDLFARPRYSHYYFGDYYERQYFRSGIYPVYAFHQSDYGYDPLFASYIATQRAPRAEVIERFRRDYRYLRDNPNVRPPRTYAGFQQLASRRDLDPRLASRRNLIEPLSQLSRQDTDRPFRVERLEPDRLTRYRDTIRETRQYQEERQRLERENVRQAPAAGRTPADTAVPSPRGQDRQRDITRSRVETPDRPTPQPGTVDRTAPGQPAAPATPRDQQRPGRTDTTTPPAQPGTPSISREQLPEETRQQLRERRSPQPEQEAARPPTAPRDTARPGRSVERQPGERPGQAPAAKPGQDQQRSARATTQPSAQQPPPRSTDRQAGGSGVTPRSVDRRQDSPVQLRLRRSPVGGRSESAQTRPAAPPSPGQQRVTPPPAPRAAEPDAKAKPDNRGRERRAPKED